MMKTSVKQMFAAVLVVLLGSVLIPVVQADGGFKTGEIVKIDMKKKIIFFQKQKYRFDSNTVITDMSGKKYKISDLKPGLTMTVGVDTERRYISFPTLKSLRLMSAIED